MTTENVTEVEETTTDTTSNDRDVSELILLDSYVGLTDGEVRKLIEYKVNVALTDEQIKDHKTASVQMVELTNEAVAACCASTTEVLNSIIASTTNYEGVSPTAVTNLLSSLEEV